MKMRRPTRIMVTRQLLIRSALTLLHCLQLLTSLYRLLMFIRSRDLYGPVPNDTLPADPPRLSIILPVKDDERTVRECAESLLQQDYPNLELVLVNDRSTDRTGEILAEMTQEHPDTVRMLTIEELPAGWMGQNYAVYSGERAATGEWVLITNGDVVLHPSCCRRTLAYALQHNCDHVTLMPRFHSPSYWAEGIPLFSNTVGIVWGRGYLTNDPSTRIPCGYGPFQLIRRSTYQAIGTHAAFPYVIPEDVTLGALVRLMGFRQHMFDGSDIFTLEWYPSVWDTIEGVKKILFASAGYRIQETLVSMGVVSLYFLEPWLAAVRSRRRRWLTLSTVAVHVAAFLFVNRRVSRQALTKIPSFPASALILNYASIHSAGSVLSQGGLHWRGTFYPLDEMRAQRQQQWERLQAIAPGLRKPNPIRLLTSAVRRRVFRLAKAISTRSRSRE